MVVLPLSFRARRAAPAGGRAGRRRPGCRGLRGAAASLGRSSTIRPPRPAVFSSTRTRSASATASSTSWVTSRVAGRCRAQRSSTSACMRSRVSASSAAKGSSSSSRRGARTRARASATRCASPPESVAGQASSRCDRPDLGKRRLSPGTGVRRRDTQGHVAPHALPRQQQRLLKRHRDRLRQGHDCVVRHRVEPGEGAQQRRLARPAGAQQGHELAGLRCPGLSAVQHGRSVRRAEAPGQVADARAARAVGRLEAGAGVHGGQPRTSTGRQASSRRSSARTMLSAP